MCEADCRNDPQGGSQCTTVSVPEPGLNMCLWKHLKMSIWCVGLGSKSIWTGMIFFVYRVGTFSIQELLSGRSRTPANGQEDSESASEPRKSGLARTMCLLKGFVQDYLTWIFSQLSQTPEGEGQREHAIFWTQTLAPYSYLLLSSPRHWDRSYGNYKNPILSSNQNPKIRSLWPLLFWHLLTRFYIWLYSHYSDSKDAHKEKN